MSEKKFIYDMKLHERIEINNYTYVTRVPGGWIYRTEFSPDEGCDTAVFVPFDNEFMTEEKPK